MPMARFALPAVLAVALCGCATDVVLMHSELRVASDTVQLGATVSGDADGALLKVYRQHEIVKEQEIWRQRALAPGAAAPQVASVGVDWSNAPGEIFPLALLVAVCAAAFPFVVLYYAGFGVVKLVEYATFDDQRAVHRATQVSVEMSLAATIETPDGACRIDLGPQPDQGYWLGKDAVARLGGPGVEVVIRDGDLATTLRLPGAK